MTLELDGIVPFDEYKDIIAETFFRQREKDMSRKMKCVCQDQDELRLWLALDLRGLITPDTVHSKLASWSEERIEILNLDKIT